MRSSSGGYGWLAQVFAFFGEDFGGFFKAMAAIGLLAEFGIDRFSVAPVAPGRAAKITFTDRIADAGIHRISLNCRLHDPNANSLQ
jgi:hypothetical protein